ncbi:GMC family oxidoreductase [Stigmatella aurantiaca]|uniref:Cholesterol oxidase n=1 Tax=Stigmatella aurantiaca (strain DW4/3-1) TaxID=378806 RepID=Q091G3_STIAD|nr:GMC family oxidoreductase [Stigmatella aurantiaca]ADO73690.1 GMC oxidoreductase family protein [Stigmatella aurantiaca DW4/3-1]EAU66369.1 GMC oxidoreductase family [Stigmatella aurantiaca DW4/3-1]
MDCDWLIIGSGFGGSVSALRLTEKGYRVLMLEKGRRLQAKDFPKTNWNLKRWLWLPQLGWRGLFKMTFFRHVTVLSGVGVGGGSLVYANTLPIPKDDFFQSGDWGQLTDWKQELAPHYREARRMLGARPNPLRTVPDQVIQEVGKEIGREDFEPTTVAIYFGEPNVTVPDPYHGGEGPPRTGCTSCGGCMLGCQVGAKNTLDKNYLYLAEKRGLTLLADTEATWVRPLPGGGYEVEALEGASLFTRRKRRFTAQNIVFAGGVLGTVDLLLKLKASPDGLPRLSDRLGEGVRTNSEALISVVSPRRDKDLSTGVAIGSILNTDEHSHLEPVRYSAGSGFFRLLGAPYVTGDRVVTRIARLVGSVLRHPIKLLRVLTVRDYAKQTIILLYMRTLDGHLRMRRGRGPLTGMRKGLTTALQAGPAPTANIPEAADLARRVAAKIDGMPMSLVNETVLGIPTTAHILGGCCMGTSAETGVIDTQHRVFGHEGLYVVDGSAVSANPGVNPSLTITALAERAMAFIPVKKALPSGTQEGWMGTPQPRKAGAGG